MWTQEQIQSARQSLKTDVDKMEIGPERVKTLLAKLSAIGENLSPQNALDSYVLCMSCLVNHEKFGGLKSSEIDRIQHIAFNILKLVGISLTSKRQGFLASDVYTALSQIYRKSGDHWRAAWYGELCLRYAGSNPSEGDALPLLIAANRALRVGDSQLALECVDDALNRQPTEAQKGRLLVTKVNLLRLTNQREAARRILDESTTMTNLTEDIRKELSWERVCLKAAEDPDAAIAMMLKSIKVGQPYHDYGYSLDASLWCFAIPKESYVHKTPRTKNLYRRFSTNRSRYGTLYDAVRGIELAYDELTQREQGIEEVERVVSKATRSLSIEREMLIFVSAFRWLVRNECQRLASLCRSQYEARCLQLSKGKAFDVLNLL